MKKWLKGLVVLFTITASICLLSSCMSTFSIEGKWKNVGDTTFGQVQSGAVVVFNGTNCNVVSPNDTYAFYEEGGEYVLDVTTYLFADTLSGTITVNDNDNIKLKINGTTLTLKRLQ